MRFNDRDVYQVLDSMALAREALNDFATKLERSTSLGSVTSAIDLRRYGSELVWEAYVEAELPNGTGLCWWLELRHQNHQWRVEAKVLAQTSAGQETVVPVMDQVLTSAAAIPGAIGTTTTELVGTLDKLPDGMVGPSQKA